MESTPTLTHSNLFFISSWLNKKAVDKTERILWVLIVGSAEVLKFDKNQYLDNFEGLKLTYNEVENCDNFRKGLVRFWVLYFFQADGTWGLEWLIVQRNGVLMKSDQMSLQRMHIILAFYRIFQVLLMWKSVLKSISTLQLFCNLDYYLTSTFSKINGATCYYVKLNQHKTFLIKNASSHSVEIAEIYSYLFSKKLREINLLST